MLKDILFKAFLDPLWEPLFLIFQTLFGATFAPLASFLEHFGFIFCVENETVAPKVPQERPSPKSPHVLGPLLGTIFADFRILSFKKEGL